MTDIVERLKAIGGPARDSASVVSALRLEAAAEIEHLNAVLDQMKADYDVIAERYLAAQAEIERLQRSEDDGADALRGAGIEIFELKAEIERLRSTVSAAEMERAMHIAKLEAEIERLRGMSDIVGRLRTERNQLELKVVSLEAEIERLQRELNAAITAKGSCELETERLQAALKECADDLESSIQAHYTNTLDYPSQKLRFDRDMEPVVTARKLMKADLPQA